jgi:putative glutamine amidotransferase
MKKIASYRFFAIFAFIIIAACGRAQTPPADPAPSETARGQRQAVPQPADRYFDTAGAPDGIVRLTIFYPSIGSIQDLLALRKEGFMPAEGIEVVGVFHAKEKTNYAAAKNFVAKNDLTWFHFHGVTADLGVETLYKNNGATADLKKIFDLSDGIIFFGGPDIPPAAYGEKTELQTRIEDPYRHYLELTAVFHLLGGSQDEASKGFLAGRSDFPILGICLGMQTMNAGTGGTLVQDVWTDIYGARYVEDVIALGRPGWHTNPHPRLFPLDRSLLSYMLHPIELLPNGKFTDAMGFKADDHPYIMSAHHQSAGRIGKGFRPAATSLDKKVVEAIDHERYPNVLGVQFHPEFDMLWDASPKYKIAPSDAELFGCKTYLEQHPPSWDFHQKIWAWFFSALKK